MARWSARCVARMKNEHELKISSSGEGSTGSERDFEPVFANKQLECIKENPSTFNLRLLRGMIALPRFKHMKTPTDEVEQLKVSS